MAFSDFSRFNRVIEKWMPNSGEGDTKASQAVTAVNKLIFKWYNDGDVFDNVHSNLDGWANDLSSYANWLYTYLDEDVKNILDEIYDCSSEDAYEDLLESLAYRVLNEDYLNTLADSDEGSIYDCDGPFEFRFRDEDEEEDEEDYEEDYEEEDFDSSRTLRNSGRRLNSSSKKRKQKTNSDRVDIFQAKYDYAMGWMHELVTQIKIASDALQAGDYRASSFRLRGAKNVIDSLEPNIRELEELTS